MALHLRVSGNVVSEKLG